jgi:hypothetical protein
MLAALGGLAAAAFYPVVEARRAAVRFSRQESASSAADAGLQWAIATWDVRHRDSLPIGSIDSAVPILEPRRDPARTQVHVIHLTGSLFWVESTGEVGRRTTLEAMRTYRLLVAVLRPAFSPLAAVIARGGAQASPQTATSGSDAPPPGWSGCPEASADEAPGVLSPPGPAGDSATFERFGQVTATSLAAHADVVVPAGSTLAPEPDDNHACQTGPGGRPVSSWGDPAHTGRSAGCERFFPVVYAPGDLAVTGGRGQGVLIVDGWLRIDGPFLFAGVVLARGGIETAGEDVNVFGLVLSAAPGVAMLRASGTIQRSTCALARARDGAARPFAARSGGWAEVF